MKIQQHTILVRDLAEGYSDNQEGGVRGYSGKLDIRPPYQREFVYDAKKREAVIQTILKGFPLNVMYWAVTGLEADEGAAYEVLDGQQRTIAICQYIQNDFAIKVDGTDRFFRNLLPEQQDIIRNYGLLVYFCEGSDKDKLDWFTTINIAGERLTQQELLNAVYTGPWLVDAKRYFSRSNGPAYQLAKKYLTGSPIRQDYLETVLKWISEEKIDSYMAEHQNDANAYELRHYFERVVEWIEICFGMNYRDEMKGVPWGVLYNTYHDRGYSASDLELEVVRLMADEDVTNKKGIYQFIFTRNEKFLNIRTFTPTQKREAYERQGGVCPYCEQEEKDKTVYELNEMEADHITPWHRGGKTKPENCQMLCKHHNRIKSGR